MHIKFRPSKWVNFAFSASLFLLIPLFTSSCGSQQRINARRATESRLSTYHAGQDEALKIVWESFPGKTDRLTPEFLYYNADDITCGEGEGVLKILLNHEEKTATLACVRGWFDPTGAYPRGLAVVVWRDGAKFSDTSFAHEACHAFYMGREVEDHEFCANGGEAVKTANHNLRKVGM